MPPWFTDTYVALGGNELKVKFLHQKKIYNSIYCMSYEVHVISFYCGLVSIKITILGGFIWLIWQYSSWLSSNWDWDNPVLASVPFGNIPNDSLPTRTGAILCLPQYHLAIGNIPHDSLPTRTGAILCLPQYHLAIFLMNHFPLGMGQSCACLSTIWQYSSWITSHWDWGNPVLASVSFGNIPHESLPTGTGAILCLPQYHLAIFLMNHFPLGLGKSCACLSTIWQYSSWITSHWDWGNPVLASVPFGNIPHESLPTGTGEILCLPQYHLAIFLMNHFPLGLGQSCACLSSMEYFSDIPCSIWCLKSLATWQLLVENKEI